MKQQYPILEEIFESELVEEILKQPIYKLEKGASFVHHSKVHEAIPLVIKGKIAVYNTDQKGRETLLYQINVGESCIIGIDSIIHQASVISSQSTHALSLSEIVKISSDLSKKWTDQYKSWRDFIFNLYGKRLQELVHQHGIVTEQRDQISHRNREIQNSITYARRIQNAVLPSEEFMKSILPNYFVIYKPRDIVSGDFYWADVYDNKLLIAAVDATGHGVPGAFMSMLGISFLYEVTSKENQLNAGLILKELRDKIKKSLKQTNIDSEQKDGFDMALCIIDLQKKELEYAGAYNPLYLIRNGELIEIKADKMPVGVHIVEKEYFTTHKTTLKTEDVIYIFSDGFADQIGGEFNSKFKTKPFKSLLGKIHNLPLNEQKEILENTFETWKGDNEQVDDVLIFSLKIP